MTQHAQSMNVEDEELNLIKYLTFHLATEVYAISIHSVREIIGVQRITPVPDVPHFIKGVINLRGKVIPIMDVRARFNLPERAYDDRTCIIVIQVEEWSVGLVVDTVSEVLDIKAENIEPPPEVLGNTGHFVDGLGKIGDDVRLILEPRRLVGADELEALQAGA